MKRCRAQRRKSSSREGQISRLHFSTPIDSQVPGQPNLPGRGGYGGAAIERLKANSIEPTQFNGANGSRKISNDGAKLKFYNFRTEAWWRFREALRPDQPKR